MLKGFVLACGLMAGVAHAQEWEVGAIGGYGYNTPDFTVKSGSATASAGFATGGVVGVFGGGDTYNYWSGEARYLYRYSNAKLSSGSTTVDFGAHTHIANADILAHFRPRESRIRPFIAFGGGVKVLVGTGAESAAQPLGRLAALTATQETLPVGDVGFGVKVAVTKSLRFRFEVQDFISPTPSKVIAAAPGASASGILNDIVGSVAVSYTW